MFVRCQARCLRKHKDTEKQQQTNTKPKSNEPMNIHDTRELPGCVSTTSFQKIAHACPSITRSSEDSTCTRGLCMLVCLFGCLFSLFRLLCSTRVMQKHGTLRTASCSLRTSATGTPKNCETNEALVDSRRYCELRTQSSNQQKQKEESNCQIKSFFQNVRC